MLHRHTRKWQIYNMLQQCQQIIFKSAILNLINKLIYYGGKTTFNQLHVQRMLIVLKPSLLNTKVKKTELVLCDTALKISNVRDLQANFILYCQLHLPFEKFIYK